MSDTHETPQLPGDPKTTGHEYDGIREFDNPTPGWWVLIFVFSIAFAVCYGVYYHAPVPDRSIHDAYDADYAADQKLRFAGMGTLQVNEQNMLLWATKPDFMAIARSTFKQNCASCHGNDGQGGSTCPNLTDDYYKNIKRMTDIPRIISTGAGNGNMPQWSTRLVPNEIALVGAYVASLRGQNLSGPSNPPHLGDVIAPWPKLEAAAASAASAPATGPATMPK